MLKESLKQSILDAVKQATDCGQLEDRQGISELIEISRAARPELGDFSCSLPLRLANGKGKSAVEIAEMLVLHLPAPAHAIATPSVSDPGFINFSLTNEALLLVLQSIHKSDRTLELTRDPHSIEEDLDSNRADLNTTPTEGAFRLQHTYAHCNANLRLLTVPFLNIYDAKEEKAIVSKEHLHEWKTEYAKQHKVFAPLFNEENKEIFSIQKQLILQLDREDPELLAQSTDDYLAVPFASYENVDLLRARVGLLLACKARLSKDLLRLGIQALEKL